MSYKSNEELVEKLTEEVEALGRDLPLRLYVAFLEEARDELEMLLDASRNDLKNAKDSDE